MCGIAGIIVGSGAHDSLSKRIEHANRAHSERGPDGSGIWVSPDGTVALGTARLAVTGGRDADQPLYDPWTGVTAFNGEVYDHRSVARENGVPRGDYGIDGLALAAVLAKRGPAGLSSISGMFAAARWDATTNTLTLVRDAVGKKPLYVAQTAGGWVFGSTLRAISVLAGRLDLRAGAVEEYLTLKSVGGRHSAFAGVEQVSPGGWLTLSTSGPPREGRWWTPPRVENTVAPEPTETRERITVAVRQRLWDGATTSVFVSGGLDSAIVLACAAQEADTKIHPIAVGYDHDDGHDERKFARDVARHLGLDLHEVTVREGDLLHLLAESVVATEDPIQDPITVPTLALARAASDVGKVVLTGDGSDEIWGGYERFNSVPVDRQRYFDRAAVFTPEALGLSGYPGSYVDDLPDLDPGPCTTDPLDTVLRLELTNRLRNYHLSRLDKITMHCGIEARAPFLDREVIEFGMRISANAKRTPTPKQPLIDAFADDLPTWLMCRPKQPFSAPITAWLSGPLRVALTDRLGPNAVSRRWVDPEPVLRTLFDPDAVDRQAAANQAWSLLCLETWYDAVARPLMNGRL